MLAPMFIASRRVIRPEILDKTPLEEARNSLRDLIRINRLFGGHRVLLDRMTELVSPVESFSFLDVGAASGDMGQVLTNRYPYARIVNLDYRESHLSGASGLRLAADAFRMPLKKSSFDFVHCSLFLHHFQNEDVQQLLASFGQLARRAVIVTDLERHILPYYFLQSTRWFLGWNQITLHDGPISVQAGFRAAELARIARAAGLRNIDVRQHRPAFRLSLAARIE